jgi:oligosaccharide repeat unit polymerase
MSADWQSDDLQAADQAASDRTNSPIQSSFLSIPAALPIPATTFEVLGYLTAVAVASLCFIVGWLTPNGAVIVMVVLLTSLIILSWIHLGQGRHPCFLFLCTLMLFQGGKLLAYMVGAEPDPMLVQSMGVNPFSIGRTHQGIVLLCLALSAICIYAPCRWNYMPLRPLDTVSVRRYLAYLYMLFTLTLPAQLIKNYLYYQYVQDHGGYFAIYQNYAGLAASTPLVVRAIALLTLPVFVAIFVFEQRKRLVAAVTVLYFGTASIVLVMGARLFVFALILTLWYVTRVKSTRRSRILVLVSGVLLLASVAQVIANYREDSDNPDVFVVNLAKFVAFQGASIDVTEVAIKYREHFSRYVGSYLLHELGESWGGSDIGDYAPGKSLDFDVSVFLNRNLFAWGGGVAGSYVGEAYAIGGVVGVLVISLLVGGGLHRLHRSSQKPMSLWIVALTMPIVLYMPRGDLLAWLSFLARSFIIALLLGIGWQVYSLITSIKHMPVSARTARPAGSAGI